MISCLCSCLLSRSVCPSSLASSVSAGHHVAGLGRPSRQRRQATLRPSAERALLLGNSQPARGRARQQVASTRARWRHTMTRGTPTGGDDAAAARCTCAQKRAGTRPAGAAALLRAAPHPSTTRRAVSCTLLPRPDRLLTTPASSPHASRCGRLVLASAAPLRHLVGRECGSQRARGHHSRRHRDRYRDARGTNQATRDGGEGVAHSGQIAHSGLGVAVARSGCMSHVFVSVSSSRRRSTRFSSW
jgi:hypothetical protein